MRVGIIPHATDRCTFPNRIFAAQKELIYEEQDKIQNIQLQEISKLKGLLNFREQEAVDQMAVLKQHQQQIDALKSDNQRMRLLESQHDDIQVSEVLVVFMRVWILCFMSGVQIHLF